MGMMQFVHDLQVYKEPGKKSYICQASYQGRVKRDRKYK